jgi:hypothetical protein
LLVLLLFSFFFPLPDSVFRPFHRLRRKHRPGIRRSLRNWVASWRKRCTMRPLSAWYLC